MQDLTVIDSKNPRSRAILAALVICAAVFLWFAVSRQLGNMIASRTDPDNPNARSAADLAISMAPKDPVARWLAASAAANDLSTEPLTPERSLEEAVRLSPFDYRWRVELGRAYEQANKVQLAENELRRAIELAPTYAFPRWHLGNFYLRQDRIDEAFAELRKAAESNRTYREQAFSLAWDYFDNDTERVEQLAADTPESMANLALFFAARGRASESLRIWNTLSEDDKADNLQVAKSIAHGLYIQRIFPQALEFARQLGIDAEALPNTVTNSGFEQVIGGSEDSRFDWRINRSDSKIDISTDPTVRHTGSRSLKLSFRTYLKPELYNTFQTVVVEPNRNYQLSFWVRTENLKTAGGPFVQVVNANDDKLIAASRAIQTGTNDWQKYMIDLRTPENCNGFTIRTVRQPCGDQCPIIGTIWYDDFELESR